MNISGSIDASGRGFRGGAGHHQGDRLLGQPGESYPGVGQYTLPKTQAPNGGGGVEEAKTGGVFAVVVIQGLEAAVDMVHLVRQALKADALTVWVVMYTTRQI